MLCFVLQKQGSGMFSGAAWWRCVCDTGMNRFLMFDSSGEASLEGFRPSDSSDCLITSRSCLIIGLTNGEYWFFFSLSLHFFFTQSATFWLVVQQPTTRLWCSLKNLCVCDFCCSQKTSLKPLSAPSHLHVFKPAATCEWKRPRLSLTQQRVSTALQLTQKTSRKERKLRPSAGCKGVCFFFYSS